MSDTFNGLPRDAFTFFAGLARNNNRAWFQAHRERYEQACREPMRQLIAALGTDPARTKMTRIKTLPAKTLATGTAVARIKRAMVDVKPLVDWLRAHVG